MQAHRLRPRFLHAFEGLGQVAYLLEYRHGGEHGTPGSYTPYRPLLKPD